MGKSIKIKLILKILYVSMITLNINADVIIDVKSNFNHATKGSNIIITCLSNDPIEWFNLWKKFPSFKYEIYNWKYKNSEVYMKVANYMDENYTLTNNNNTSYRYNITLNLINVNYKFVGFYYCKQKSFEILEPSDLFLYNTANKTNMTRIYVEVTDEDHPIAEIPTTLHVFETDNCQIRLSCKPTNHSKYEDGLKTENGELLEYIGDRPEHVYRLPKHLAPNSTNNLTCSIEKGKEQYITVHVHRMMDKEKDECKDLNHCAKILSETGYIGIERKELVFTCIYNARIVKTVDWIYPKNSLAKQEERAIDNLKTNCGESNNKKLIIKNLKKTDNGTYGCIVKTIDGRIFSPEINITSILDGNKPHLLASVNQKTIKSHSNEKEFSYVVKHVSDENTQFYLDFNNISYANSPNKKIYVKTPFVKDLSKKIQILNYDGVLVVMMRNLTVCDTGNYTVNAFNQNGNSSVTFELLVEGHPIFTFGKKTEKNGKITVDFNIIGYLPAFNVTLELRNYNNIIKAKYTKTIKEISNISRTVFFTFEEIIDLLSVECKIYIIGNKDPSYSSGVQPIPNENGLRWYQILLITFMAIVFIYFIVQIIVDNINKYYILETLETLGSGNFGEVVKARIFKPFRRIQTVAIKWLINPTDQENVQFIKEADVAQSLPNHPNVVRFIGTMVRKNRLMLISEFCNGCDLKKFLNDDKRGIFVNQIRDDRINQNITEPDTEHNNGNSSNTTDQQPRIYTTTHMLEWSAQIVCGLKFLILNHVFHRDIAARNMILCEDGEISCGVIKICDLGLARIVSNERSNIWYWEKFDQMRMAIESLESGIFNEKTEVWGFGLLMLEIFSKGKDPFPSLSQGNINANGISSALRQMERPLYATTEIYEVIKRCLEIEPINRPTFADLEVNINRILRNETISFSNGRILNDPTNQLSNPNEVIEMSVIANVPRRNRVYKKRPLNLRRIERFQTGSPLSIFFKWINQ